METIYKIKKGTYMTREEKLEFLKSLKRARVYYEAGNSAEFDYNDSSVYFRHYNGGKSYQNYDRYYWDETEKILSYMDLIVRIDKKLDSDYYPLWTVEEGFVKEGETFIKLRGKYYSATFLEKLLDSIDRLKSQINLPYL